MAQTLSGQLKLLKITPDNFLFPPSMGSTLPGQCFALLKIFPEDFLFVAIHGANPIGPMLVSDHL
jgi:hypothetical protein